MEPVVKNVVIVGGGIGGMTLIKTLLKKRRKRDNVTWTITLVDPSSHYYYRPAGPRLLVDDSAVASVPFAQCFDTDIVRHIQGVLDSVDPVSKTVTVSGTKKIVPYDVLVFASGRSYEAPFGGLGVSVEEARERLRQSNHVVVVGGGATGVETAAEIKSAFPQKEVRLVHSKPKLLNAQFELSDAQRDLVAQRLGELGVVVQLNASYQITGHEQQDGVMLIKANGGTPNTQYVPKAWLDDKSLVKVNSRMQVLGSDASVYALGDIVSGFAPNFKTVKMLHAPVVAANVLAALKGKKPSAQAKKLPGMVDGLLILALGPNDAFGTGMGKLFAKMKAKDYMIPKSINEVKVN